MSAATRAPGRHPGAALLALLWVAGCAGGGDGGAPQQVTACPGVLILQGAERTAAYAEGAAGKPDGQRYLAVLTNLRSACGYDETGVDVDLAFDLIVERGPALAGNGVELTYFIATMGPGEEILDKQLLTSDIEFTGDEQVAGSAEQLTLRLPTVSPADAVGHALYVGFQLEDAELDQRLQPLLR
jgi:hypothetical protein